MKIPTGVYPVMITPYTKDNEIDFEAVDRIVDFYAASGCEGVFAVCQSSEMFFLSEDERAALAKRVVKASAGRMCVVASGHISDAVDDQIRELTRVYEAGVDAVVMVSNRLAAADEDDDVFLANMHRILEAIPGAVFGMYECPYPYKRLLSPRVLEEMAACGRFSFIKDTCCDAELIKRRIEAAQGRLQIFNANTATLLETLQAGLDGYSGIMANLHPELYVWLVRNFKEQPEKAVHIAALLTLASGIERGYYPTSAKYHMNLIGVPMTIKCRCQPEESFTQLHRYEIDDLVKLEKLARKYIMK